MTVTVVFAVGSTIWKITSILQGRWPRWRAFSCSVGPCRPAPRKPALPDLDLELPGCLMKRAEIRVQQPTMVLGDRVWMPWKLEWRLHGRAEKSGKPVLPELCRDQQDDLRSVSLDLHQNLVNQWGSRKCAVKASCPWQQERACEGPRAVTSQGAEMM